MTFGLILLVSVLLGVVIWLFPAYRFLRKYEQRLAAGSGTPQRAELRLGDVPAHLYSPPDKTSSTLILVPGLHPKGIYDTRFIAFAETCAEAGFHVIAPDIAEFRNFKITNESVHNLRSIMDAAPEKLGSKTVGMLGISYGAGPVFLIAAERKLDFVVSIGGYFSLSHAIEFSLTGAHPGGAKRGAHEWGRLIFALNHIDHVAPAQDLEILRESLALRLELKEKEAEALEKDLTPAGKHFMHGVLEGLTTDQRNTFWAVLQKREQEAFELSPERVLSKIDPDTQLYLLHGKTDKAIPYEETLELQAALKRAGLHAHCLITEGVTHVDITKLSSIWELLKLLHWERLLLRERNG